MDSEVLCRTATPAPALSRGLAVLTFLTERPALVGLEELAGRLQLPKASVFRLLDTLCRLGLVRKTPDRSYEPLWALQPLRDPGVLRRQRIAARMPALVSATDCTAEWYEPATEGLKLILQKQPDREVRVQARPGFLREWGDELEAVARLGYAFAREAPPRPAGRAHVADGKLAPVAAREAKAMVVKAKAAGWARDDIFNANGVRRMAMAALDPNGSLAGVLALAQVFHFSRHPWPQNFLSHLQQVLVSP